MQGRMTVDELQAQLTAMRLNKKYNYSAHYVCVEGARKGDEFKTPIIQSIPPHLAPGCYVLTITEERTWDQKVEENRTVPLEFFRADFFVEAEAEELDEPVVNSPASLDRVLTDTIAILNKRTEDVQKAQLETMAQFYQNMQQMEARAMEREMARAEETRKLQVKGLESQIRFLQDMIKSGGAADLNSDDSPEEKLQSIINMAAQIPAVLAQFKQMGSPGASVPPNLPDQLG